MNSNAKLSEHLAIVATLDPASVAAGTVTTGWVSVANLLQLAAIIQTGVLGASATLDAKIQQATSSGGAGAKDVSGKAITQIVKATGDNKQAVISFRTSDLDVEGGFAYVRLSATVGTAASIFGALLVALPRYEPASAYNQAAVAQTV